MHRARHHRVGPLRDEQANVEHGDVVEPLVAERWVHVELERAAVFLLRLRSLHRVGGEPVLTPFLQRGFAAKEPGREGGLVVPAHGGLLDRTDS